MTGRAVLVAATLTLSGCAADTFEVPEGFFGAVVADEPRAALLARDVLVGGGTAADAAVSMYFTLAATLPSSAGLSATGSCLVFDPASKSYERLSFYPQPAAAQGSTVALPVGPRAMFALHARHGVVPFEELMIQGERLARFGEPISRALAHDLAADGAKLARDRETAGVFVPASAPLRQGDVLVQVELSATLARLRREGVGALYSGPLARTFIDSVTRAGFAIDADRLRAALPRWESVVGVEHDFHKWAVAAPTAEDAWLAQTALALILDAGDWNEGDRATRLHLLAEAINRAVAARDGANAAVVGDTAERLMAGYDADRRGLSAPLPRLASALGSTTAGRSGATAFFVVDRRGMAVDCAIGLGASFGTGRLAPGLGLFLAPATSAKGDGPGAFGLLVANTNTGQTQMAVSASGGRAALSALLSATLDHWEQAAGAEPAIAAPRAHYAGGADLLVLEQGAPATVREGLTRRGYRLDEGARLGSVGLFRCVEGIPRSDLQCTASGDPRSRGLLLYEKGG